MRLMLQLTANVHGSAHPRTNTTWIKQTNPEDHKPPLLSSILNFVAAQTALIIADRVDSCAYPSATDCECQ